MVRAAFHKALVTGARRSKKAGAEGSAPAWLMIAIEFAGEAPR